MPRRTFKNVSTMTLHVTPHWQKEMICQIILKTNGYPQMHAQIHDRPHIPRTVRYLRQSLKIKKSHWQIEITIHYVHCFKQSDNLSKCLDEDNDENLISFGNLIQTCSVSNSADQWWHFSLH